METFTMAVTDGRSFDSCGYCGIRRQITARARIAGSNAPTRDGTANVCRPCAKKGDTYLRSSFAPQEQEK
jgi:hypothetical protein